VSILVYGRRSDRFDQIHGDNFEYDPNSGDIVAHGDVAIDLEGDAQGPVRPDQATPVELKNPVHLKTRGLSFNQKTGAAATRERVDFSTPQAAGSAVGANYDSQSNTLTLASQVRLETREGAVILARHATVTQSPRRVLLEAARLERPQANLDCERLTLYLRDDNTVSRMAAAGGVRGATAGENPAQVEAPQGDFLLDPKNNLLSGVLSGGVTFRQEGPSPLHGSASRALLTFGAKNVLTQIQAKEAVRLIQNQRATTSQAAQTVEMASDGLDLFLEEGRLDHGVTGGVARITVRPQTPTTSQGDTVITAGRFNLKFGEDSRLRTLHGEPDARIVAATPGQPDKVSLSQTLDVAFNSTDGGIESVVQQGNVRYNDAQRNASAREAHYTPGDENLVLTGSPRWTEAGGTTTARLLKINRRTGDAFAEGEVKTTYRDNRTQPQPDGALLGGREPIHVTAEHMAAHRQDSTAIYTGSARLWQGSSILEAPEIEFNQTNRSLNAKGARQPVSTVFNQNGGKNDGIPVKVTSSSLVYSDLRHLAVFQGEVLLSSADGTVSSDNAEVFLTPRAENAPHGTSDANRIERIVATGHVLVVQPSRKATGNTMTYTAADGKYVMTGGRPSIFDAEHGLTTGDSLTFYSRDDRLLVDSGNATRAITQTHTGK